MITIGEGPERGQRPRVALRYLHEEALFGCIWLAWTTGAFQTRAALLLGGADLVIGYLGALPYLGTLVGPAVSALVERVGKPRALSYAASVVARGLWVAGGAALLLPVAAGRRHGLALFTGVATVSALALAASNLAWYSWISEIAPARIRGRFLGIRFALSNGTVAGASVLGGAILAWGPAERGEGRLALALLMAAGAAIGALGARRLLRVPEASLARGGGHPGFSTPPIRRLTEPLFDPNFRRFIAFQFLFVGGMNMAAPFLNAFLLERTGVTTSTAAALGMVTPLASLLPFLGWGRAVDRFGNRPVVALSAAVAALIPFGWAVVGPSNVIGLVVFLNAVAGFAWAGFNVGVPNMVLGVSPKERVHVYLAASTALASLGPALSPFVSAWVLRLARSLAPDSDPYRAVFLISGGVRLATLALLPGIKEPGSRSIRNVFGSIASLEGVLSVTGVETVAAWVSDRKGRKSDS